MQSADNPSAIESAESRLQRVRRAKECVWKSGGVVAHDKGVSESRPPPFILAGTAGFDWTSRDGERRLARVEFLDWVRAESPRQIDRVRDHVPRRRVGTLIPSGIGRSEMQVAGIHRQPVVRRIHELRNGNQPQRTCRDSEPTQRPNVGADPGPQRTIVLAKRQRRVVDIGDFGKDKRKRAGRHSVATRVGKRARRTQHETLERRRSKDLSKPQPIHRVAADCHHRLSKWHGRSTCNRISRGLSARESANAGHGGQQVGEARVWTHY